MRRTLPQGPQPAASEKKSRLLITIAEVATVVTGFSYLAAATEARARTAHWALESNVADVGQVQLVHDGLLVGTMTLALFTAAAGLAFGMSRLRGKLARHWRWLARDLASAQRKQRVMSDAAFSAGLAIAFLALASSLGNCIEGSTEHQLQMQKSFVVVKEDNSEYVVVYTSHDAAWAYAYARPLHRLCSEFKVFKLDEHFSGVREELGQLSPPMPKKANTDACLRPLPSTAATAQTSETTTK